MNYFTFPDGPRQYRADFAKEKVFQEIFVGRAPFWYNENTEKMKRSSPAGRPVPGGERTVPQ